MLNERGRIDRLSGVTPRSEVLLRDGTSASAGDVVLTRHNDRRLTTSHTDWVKNGDRWRTTEVYPDGSIGVARMSRPCIAVRLPAAYVTEHVQLGYAATLHSAQGLTVDTCHTVLAGTEDRQLLYVALTRGREGNHVYLAPPADAEPGLLHHAESPSGLQVLRGILARDGAQESATTLRRIHADPGTQLHEEVLRYLDTLGLAMHSRDGDLDQLESGGPLPWLPRIPSELTSESEWGTHLQVRGGRIADLASRIFIPATATWIDDVGPDVRKEIAVWRAAHAIPGTETRPTGPRVDGVGWKYQRELDRRIGKTASHAELDNQWADLLPTEVTKDPAAYNLKRRLSGLGVEGAQLAELICVGLRTARPLPVENPADALWWRICAAHDAAALNEVTGVAAVRTSDELTKRREPVHARPISRGREVPR